MLVNVAPNEPLNHMKWLEGEACEPKDKIRATTIGIRDRKGVLIAHNGDVYLSSSLLVKAGNVESVTWS